MKYLPTLGKLALDACFEPALVVKWIKFYLEGKTLELILNIPGFERFFPTTHAKIDRCLYKNIIMLICVRGDLYTAFKQKRW